jgi:DNA-binding protein HU-beta
MVTRSDSFVRLGAVKSHDDIDLGGVAVTKQEFVNQIAQRSGLSNRDAGKAVDAFLETITDTLKTRDSVNFTGFGKFSTSDRAARQGVNPRTGEKVQIAAATVPKFSAGSALKSAVRG